MVDAGKRRVKMKGETKSFDGIPPRVKLGSEYNNQTRDLHRAKYWSNILGFDQTFAQDGHYLKGF